MSGVWRCLAGLTVLAASAQAAVVSSWPVKPIRVVVGGSPDAVPRMLSEKFIERWGHPLVVDQRAGAGGTISAEIVARATPDGYTLLMATSSHAMNVNFYKVPYDMARDFVPVVGMASTAFVLAVHPGVAARSVPELVALAKTRPGALNFGSGGHGSPAHLAGSLFMLQTDTRMVHVPYKTVAEAVTDVISGQTHLMFIVSTAAVPQIVAGRVRALGVTALKRTSVIPDLPTLDEQGVTGFEAMAWYGLLAPARTPATIVQRLADAVLGDLQLPDITRRYATLGLKPLAHGLEAFAGFVQRELEKWRRAAQEAMQAR